MPTPAPPLKAADLLAQVAPDRAQRRAKDAAAHAKRRAEYRARFPLMADMVDIFRADDTALEPGEDALGAKPIFASNQAGETWGCERSVDGFAVDGDKLAHLPAFEASWRKFYGKRADTPATYRERMQRAIKPI